MNRIDPANRSIGQSIESIEGDAVPASMYVHTEDSYRQIERRLQRRTSRKLPQYGSMWSDADGGHERLALSTQWYDQGSRRFLEASAESSVSEMLCTSSWRVLVLGTGGSPPRSKGARGSASDDNGVADYKVSDDGNMGELV